MMASIFRYEMPAIALRRHTPLILQIDKVRKNRATCGTNKAWV
jgi:hypothetical protein